MANISMFITRPNNQTYEMPIMPESFEISSSSGNTQVSVIELGEITVKNAQALKDLSFDLTFPRNMKKRRAYFTASKLKWTNGDKYKELWESIRDKNETIRVVISGIGVSFQCTIASLTIGMSGGYAGEWVASISLKEWRDYSPKVIKTFPAKKPPIPKQTVPPAKPKAKAEEQRPAANGGPVAIGSIVIANGQLRRDSYGAAPGVTEVNARRRVNFINKGAPFPIHVEMEDGSGWRGWLRESEVKVV